MKMKDRADLLAALDATVRAAFSYLNELPGVEVKALEERYTDVYRQVTLDLRYSQMMANATGSPVEMDERRIDELFAVKHLVQELMDHLVIIN